MHDIKQIKIMTDLHIEARQQGQLATYRELNKISIKTSKNTKSNIKKNIEINSYQKYYKILN